MSPESSAAAPGGRGVRLFLCGDVMTGRGIDQVLRHPGDPRLFEPVVTSALDYVGLAERENGPVPRPVDDAYVWGRALAELERLSPDVRIANLETAITTSSRHWPGKSVHYRMHPTNVTCLQAAGFDCGVLANNHSLDWGRAGLLETLDVLHASGLGQAGAGRDIAEASAPAVFGHGSGGRVLVFAFGHPGSGIPREWAATEHRPGIRILDDLSERSVETLADEVRPHRTERDIVVASIHWGPNWGYEIPGVHRSFAHGLVESGTVDVVHGHSSHHALGIEVHRNRPILFGCGDFLNDYEGIRGHEGFGADLALMYFPVLDPGGAGLLELRIVPLRIRRFRLEAADAEGREWVRAMLSREGRALNTRAETAPDGSLLVHWEES